MTQLTIIFSTAKSEEKIPKNLIPENLLFE